MRNLLFVLLLLASAPAWSECAEALDFSYRPLAGKQPVHLCEQYQGKVLLVVNTASKCGYTPQYEGLEALHARLSDRGFAVLGFPSNDFMGQEPGTEAEIKEFCTLTYGVKFPMFEKVSVRGNDATQIYAYLAKQTGQKPGWNFHKYLIDRDGKVVGSYGSKTTPEDAALLAKIDALLSAAPEEQAD